MMTPTVDQLFIHYNKLHVVCDTRPLMSSGAMLYTFNGLHEMTPDVACGVVSNIHRQPSP